MIGKISIGALLLIFLAASAGGEILESTAEGRKEVSVTVYNNDLGLVREVRGIELSGGVMHLRYMGVASRIDPTSVLVSVVEGLKGFELLEQNYEFDLMSPAKLMEKYVGKRVELAVTHPSTGEESIVQATLLSVNEGPVYRIGDEIHLGHPGRVIVPEIPGNLIAQPTLVWLIGGKKGAGEIEVTYLTGGFSWKADYVALLGDDDEEMDLTGWVTLTNTSGASYEEAKLKLVAGDVHRVRPLERPRMRADVLYEAAALKTGFEEEAFFEYHLYSLPRRTTILDRQTKQIELLSARGVAVKKEYVLPATWRRDFNRPSYVEPEKENPLVVLRFENSEDNSLGQPLPGGIFRFYKEDSEGMLQLVGEDRIEHTASKETVSLEAGKAFDITAERAITDYNVVKKDKEWEYECTVKLRSAKETSVAVAVYDLVHGEWDVVEWTHEPVKESATNLRFAVTVEPGRETTLRYRVRVRNY
jgi:hypothetical protein